MFEAEHVPECNPGCDSRTGVHQLLPDSGQVTVAAVCYIELSHSGGRMETHQCYLSHSMPKEAPVSQSGIHTYVHNQPTRVCHRDVNGDWHFTILGETPPKPQAVRSMPKMTAATGETVCLHRQVTRLSVDDETKWRCTNPECQAEFMMVSRWQG